ncbi:DUF2339 domain-containing protein [Superficieibacter sp. BNK-5]|uniref:DUF2339 domain-containing protein n=1 Tax=Superficieibacter sp. BNK-5 TaxID=3376142 RepID=UPI0039BF258D
MDEIVIFGIIVALFYLLVVPALALNALAKGRRNQYQIDRLTAQVAELQNQLARHEPPLTETPTIAESAAAMVSPEIPLSRPPEPAAPPDIPITEPAPAVDIWKDSPAPPAKEKYTLPQPVLGLLSWFTQGNPLAKVGIILLFFGLAFLVKYSVERDLFPVELRLSGAALASIALLVVGWRLRHKNSRYALILQGGAVGALYITLFGAFRLYHLLPHFMAFGLMLVVCAASVGLAVMQRALSLAMLASIGGYLSPVLLSTGGGSHVALFSYYLLLSLGILAISLWQPWRPLNLLGFIFTFGVGGLWGVQGYQPEFWFSCQLFLLANMIIFGVLSVALALRSRRPGEKIVDGVLLFGTPLVGFGMQYAITRHWTFGPAFSALCFAAGYLLLAWVALKRYPSLGKPLVIAALALGGVFITLAIPLALSAQWTSMAWALEGVGVLWLGHTQKQIRMSYSGTALQLLALGSAVWAWQNDMGALTFSLTFAILALSWLIAGYIWRAVRIHALWRLISLGLLSGGIALWMACLMGTLWLLTFPLPREIFLLLALVAASSLLWRWAGMRLHWRALRYAVWLLWPVMAGVVLWQVLIDTSPLHAGWLNLLWLPVLAIAIFLLRREVVPPVKFPLKQGLHLALFWTILFALGGEIVWQTARFAWGMEEWRDAARVTAIALTIKIVLIALRRGIWPVARYRQLYAFWGVLPLIPLAVLFLLFGNLMDGVMPDWHYLPLLNPLEESAMLTLLTLILWWCRIGRVPYPESGRAVAIFSAAVIFWWGNGILLRVLAYYSDTAWRIETLWDSRLIQTTFALLWGLTALSVMAIATRRNHRIGWFTGATLLAVVVIKLFLVDSAGEGGLLRAVAFIGVAVLILIIGYFSPLPPGRGKMTRERTDK